MCYSNCTPNVACQQSPASQDNATFGWELALEPWRRSLVANIVLSFVRRDGTQALPELLTLIITDVKRRIQRKAEYLRRTAHPEHRDRLQEDFDFLSGLLEDLRNPDESLWRYLRYRQEWASLTPEQKAQARRQRHTGNHPPMSERPPSEAQTTHLRALGFTGPDPENMAQASELITEYRAKRGVRR